MGADCPFFRNDVDAVPAALLQLDGPSRLCSSALCGEDADIDRAAACLALSLLRICLVERIHDILGVQRYNWRWNCRRPSEFASDAGRVSFVQRLAQGFRRHIAVYISRSHMDSLGKGLFRLGHFLAVACSRECVRTHSGLGPVVRRHRHSGRFALGLGLQSWSFRTARVALRWQMARTETP